MNIKSNKGMTLVEVIATVAIMAAVMIPISLIFTTAYSNFITESDKSEAQKSARAVLYGKGLYGDGLISYGVIGDLQRSNVSGEKIIIEDFDTVELKKGRRISISDDKGLKCRYSLEGTKLEYEYRIEKSGKYEFITEDYLTEKSVNKKDVKIIDFTVEKKEKGTDIDNDPETQTIINNDIIEVCIKVECGQSGVIILESSYRIPIEK
ncbi:prepilin-type N-terminal cleavage/methylation domain-containing protein [Ruminiclostridium sufflavum DSM 19573]|uniref:Prepilin-type N-terminal cleavage/methylation domain-containing protein n=1 Tax=Ruminiclostridium sufflavum DSM 19573 TaxID=1121337 RepID=A0A318XIJ7_9FIRM|nr:prepilin-type N-terminal cleavage/methylation domain-containing protein [Ruminiclostridium sufflavum]PYG85643.1 prepilin-type N-terminal cleavage/methylation domain-containing protein [Ruminiclostridium sufflavum DSM 19573]